MRSLVDRTSDAVRTDRISITSVLFNSAFGIALAVFDNVEKCVNDAKKRGTINSRWCRFFANLLESVFQRQTFDFCREM